MLSSAPRRARAGFDDTQAPRPLLPPAGVACPLPPGAPPFPAHGAQPQARSGMGQQPSREDKEDKARRTRLVEVHALIIQTHKLLNRLNAPAASDVVRARAAGVPVAPGSAGAQYAAASDYLKRMYAELAAIRECKSARREGRSLPMPDPTPPLCLTLPPALEAAAMPTQASACTAAPGTPMGGASPQRGQRGGSSSSEEGAHAGGVVERSSEVVPLLGAGAERLAAPGLRRRQGYGEGI